MQCVTRIMNCERPSKPHYTNRRDILDSSRNRSSFRTNSEFRAAGSTPCRVSTLGRELLARARSKPISYRARSARVLLLALCPPTSLRTFFGLYFRRDFRRTRQQAHLPCVLL